MSVGSKHPHVDDQGRILITISRRDSLPAVCATCGTFTDDRRTLQRLHRVEGEQSGWAQVGIFVLGILFGPLGFLLQLFAQGGEGGRVIKLKLRVPQCLPCQRRQKLHPYASDLKQRTMSFWVSPIFVREWERQRPPEANPSDAYFARKGGFRGR